ncbi:nudix hydrolase chloroplastic-like isoform X1 [Micractinium conductrix]|uniref:Nudix hydrolase chloroplastic-like isoform X1 n=1 Tax=Micractinium conductrix TaxID=554055 RepID=A0A2P6V8V2_9CHLO|nr:nudix hydrolase chloroplastic-like isoform X1 [Micractinium conductrix]|eukprot:PSC70515.1 nudix hydrolase chloroplastic-like isoform X1 [Micractinium conductrix]
MSTAAAAAEAGQQHATAEAAAAAVPPAAVAAAAAPPFDFAACIPRFLHWVDFCNSGAAAAAADEFLLLTVGGSAVGFLKPSFAERLLQFPDVFRRDGGGLALHPSLATQQQRTAAVAGVLEVLRGEGLIEGWRNELYPAVRAFHDEPAFLIERAAAPHFGIKAYGVHINGYVTLPDGSKELWVARRSRSKPTWPGKLDHIAAGGQPHGLGCMENVVKECEEEASIPTELAARATAVGAVSYTSLQPAGLKRDVLYCFDLELPADFAPRPQDGEVEEFMRMPAWRVAEIMTTSDEYKENCNLVIIDFFFRHGYLTPDMPGYLELLRGLKSGDMS